jgi:hypothetical protein
VSAGTIDLGKGKREKGKGREGKRERREKGKGNGWRAVVLALEGRNTVL